MPNFIRSLAAICGAFLFLVIGHLLRVIGSFAARHWSLVFCPSSFVLCFTSLGHWSFAARHWSLVFCCASLVIGLLSFIFCPFSFANSVFDIQRSVFDIYFHSINHSPNQPLTQSTTHPINQPTNQSPTFSPHLFLVLGHELYQYF